MVYFYHRKMLKCYLRERMPFTIDQLMIEYEFTESAQEDGHAPWHRDNRRSFAECVIRNIEIEPIMAVLCEHDIKGFKAIRGCGIKVKPVGKLDPDCFMPLYRMDLWIQFTPEEDTHKSLANQLLNSIPWQVMKEGIYDGKSCSFDWEFGQKGTIAAELAGEAKKWLPVTPNVVSPAVPKPSKWRSCLNYFFGEERHE
jgi:hypothetical protein